MDCIINLMDKVNGTSTNIEGLTLYAVLSREIESGNIIKLSLKESTPMSSSFLNSSLGELVDRYGIDVFKKHVRLINYTASQAEYIKKYLSMLKA